MTLRRLCFRSPAGPVTVVADTPEAAAALGALFPDDRDADPGGEPELTVLAEAGGYAVQAPAGRWHHPLLSDALVRTELLLAEELARRSGLPGLHAGGVVVGGRAVLLPGDGGQGKSSMTAALARRGAPVLGDDVVLLDGGGRAHPFRRLLKVEEPARTLLGLPAPPPPLADLWPDAAFFRPSELGSRWADPAPVGSIVRLHRREGAPTGLVPARASSLLPGLLSGIVLSERIAPGVFDAVVAALSEARCWDLGYASTAEGADALLAALT